MKLEIKKVLFILVSDPASLAVLASPKELGADIACGDGQTLGISLSFGGPYVGYIACTNELIRKLPGRIVGMTNDVDGKRGFVLTLQAREQHIRREKATSNICSNESLMALNVAMYCAVMGKSGLTEVNKMRFSNSHYLEEKLLGLDGLFTKVTKKEFFDEFVLSYKKDAKKLNKYLEKHGYLGGLELGDGLILFCATEMNTKDEIDDFVSVIEKF